MKIIDKIVHSKYAPHDTNVVWIDVNDENNPIEKHFINGKWIEMSGSGSGLPKPNAEDASKVMQVVRVQKGSSVITSDVIPQRTETLGQYSNSIDFNNLDNIELFSDGAECTAVINGTEYTGTARQEYELDIGDIVKFSIKDENENRLFEFYRYLNNDRYIQLKIYESPKQDSYTVYLSTEQEVVDYDYNWEPGAVIPIPTKNDLGKTLVVTEEINTNEQVVIVPEQQVPEDMENVPLESINIDYFVENSPIEMLVTMTDDSHGVTEKFTGIIMDEDGLYTYIDDCPFYIWLDESYPIRPALFFYSSIEIPEGATLTVKLSAASKSYKYSLKENSTSNGPKIVTILNYDHIQQDSILIDADGNEFHEGVDYEITYKDSGFDFDRIDNIFVYNHKGNWICNMIALVSGSYTYTKIIEESYFYESDSYPSNLSYWDKTNNHYVGYWESA